MTQAQPDSDPFVLPDIKRLQVLDAIAGSIEYAFPNFLQVTRSMTPIPYYVIMDNSDVDNVRIPGSESGTNCSAISSASTGRSGSQLQMLKAPVLETGEVNLFSL